MAKANRKTAESTTGGPAAWLQRHAQEALSALGRLYRRPVSSALTVAVIGIALALPAGLLTALQNLQLVGYSWERSLSASVFLKDAVSAERGRQFAAELGEMDGADGHYYISREEALDEFRRLSGFSEALDLLDKNPLPAVAVIWIHPSLDDAARRALLDAIRERPEVDQVEMDTQWLERLQAIMDIGSRVATVLAVLLGLAVLLIVGNTIRLDIHSRRGEIVVMKLVGATDGFVRRPFLYTGFWYGLLGGLVAVLCIGGALAALAEPVQRLATLYESDFQLAGLGFSGSLRVLGIAIGIGWLGALATVAEHLGEIEPE